MPDTSDVVVIGGGLVGLATAHAIVERNPGVRVGVLEAEDRVATHQSGRNSGVLHSGVYYKPGSLKARLCVEGAARMVEYCGEHGVAMRRRGKIIIASRENDIAPLEELHRRGVANGLDGIELVDAEGITEQEPNATGLAALVIPQAGVVDFPGVAASLARGLTAAGHEVRTGFAVTSIVHGPTAYSLEAASGATWEAAYVVNCAGLQSDRVARMAGVASSVRIMPFRGEYYVLSEHASSLVRELVYPVPDPRFPFLGVHFTRRIDGTVEVGPNAVLALGRHHYRGESKADLAETRELLSSRELWKLAGKYWATATKEIVRSRSRRLYSRAASALVPGIEADDLRRGGSGIRAQAVDRDGGLVDDFVIEHGERTTHVLNAPSPAATSCLAIGDRIASEVLEALE